MSPLLQKKKHRSIKKTVTFSRADKIGKQESINCLENQVDFDKTDHEIRINANWQLIYVPKKRKMGMGKFPFFQNTTIASTSWT